MSGLEGELTAEDHEVMSVPVLRLHDARSTQSRCIHELHISGFPQRVVRVMILQLPLPDRMDQVALFIIRRLLEQRPLRELLSPLAILLTLPKQPPFLLGVRPHRADAHGLLRSWVQRHHSALTCDHYIFRLNFLALFRRFGDLQADLHAASTCGVRDHATKLQIAYFGQGVIYGDPVEGGSHSSDSISGVFVGDYARERVKVHEDCPKADVAGGVHIRI